ncbi:MAG: DCC1-like thiol-disulfide oxidoreductase family protein [Bacteriovoracaceae bacterium]|nr:DCC1-like thiol-disulfide oxidoreductase family protein [Bacteriovoracaceae bacterium]
MDKDYDIIFFDGVCNLCNGFVDFFMRFKSPTDKIKIASLQGETAKTLLPHSIFIQGPTSVILLKKNSDQLLFAYLAIRRISSYLRFPLNWVLPPILWLFTPLGPWLYQFVANHRYAIFGKSDSCRLPTALEREFFLP